MSTVVSTLHIRPVKDGSWSLILDDVSAIYPTEGQAIARVYEMILEPGETEVFIHEADGRVRATVTIRRGPQSTEVLEPSDLDDPAARAEALRITPSNARLKAGIARRKAGLGDQWPVEGADLEANPADLY